MYREFYTTYLQASFLLQVFNFNSAAVVQTSVSQSSHKCSDQLLVREFGVRNISQWVVNQVRDKVVRFLLPVICMRNHEQPLPPLNGALFLRRNSVELGGDL